MISSIAISDLYKYILSINNAQNDQNAQENSNFTLYEKTIICSSIGDFFNDANKLSQPDLLLPTILPYIITTASSLNTINSKNVITKSVLLNQGIGGKLSKLLKLSKDLPINYPDLTVPGQFKNYMIQTYVNKINTDTRKITSSVIINDFYGPTLSLAIFVATIAIGLQQRNAKAGEISSATLLPSLYKLKNNSIITDVTSGKRGGFTAKSGYDFASGLGNINIPNFINYIKNVNFSPAG